MRLMVIAILLMAQQATAIMLQDGLAGYDGTGDTSIYQDYPQNANGGYPYLFSGATVNSRRRALIRFDLSDVDLQTIEGSVSLTLVLDRSGLEAGDPDLYTLHRLISPWGEGSEATSDPSTGGIGVPASAGDATWESAMHSVALWSTPGGDYVSEPSATLAIARWDSIRPENNVYTFSSPQMKDDVLYWRNNPADNHGWVLIGVETIARNARRFHAAESTDQSARPLLEIGESPLHVPSWTLYSDYRKDEER